MTRLPKGTLLDTPKHLPEQYYLLIGKLIHGWSRVENELVLAAKRLLDINMKEARVAMRTPRPNEILEMIQEIAAIHDEDLGDYQALMKMLIDGERDRNLIVHAVWMTADHKYLVQKTTGKTQVPGGKAIKSKIMPGAVDIDEHWLNARILQAKECLAQAGKLSSKCRVLGLARRTQKPAPAEQSA